MDDHRLPEVSGSFFSAEPALENEKRKTIQMLEGLREGMSLIHHQNTHDNSNEASSRDDEWGMIVQDLITTMDMLQERIGRSDPDCTSLIEKMTCSLHWLQMRRSQETENMRSDDSMELNLREALGKNVLLEEEVAQLEQRALEAIAEAGRLRRRIDEMERVPQACTPEMEEIVNEHMDLRNRLSRETDERMLLTKALNQSETEIARLARSIEELTSKFHAA